MYGEGILCTVAARRDFTHVAAHLSGAETRPKAQALKPEALNPTNPKPPSPESTNLGPQSIKV